MNYFMLSCAITSMLNLSEEPWNKEDDSNMRLAMRRCSELYSDAPCLKRFIKKQPRMYEAICGEET